MRRPEFPVFDGHNDTLLDLHVPKRDGGRSFFVEGDTGHIDLPRAERGGFAGGFFAIFVPPLVVDPSDDAVANGRAVRQYGAGPGIRAVVHGGRNRTPIPP